jgi:hypothetical protein
VEIRKQTGNKKGLDDALRGIMQAGGDMRHDWSLEEALDVGDRTVGVTVLKSLYEKMKSDPYPVDLPALWQQLGIIKDGDDVRFVDDAPLSKIREAITFGNPPAASAAPHAVNLGRRSNSTPAD